MSILKIHLHIHGNSSHKVGAIRKTKASIDVSVDASWLNEWKNKYYRGIYLKFTSNFR